MADYCKHELPRELCDVCSPRQPPPPPARRVISALDPIFDSDTVVVAANNAYGEYIRFHTYVCQPDRSFRKDTRWMAFYAQESIQREVPEITYIRDRVPFTEEEIQRLRASGDETNLHIADLIRTLVTQSTRQWNHDYKVFLLTRPDDPRTYLLPRKIQNDLLDHKGTGTAFTQHQRYTRLTFLQQGPRLTSDLIALGVAPEESPDKPET